MNKMASHHGFFRKNLLFIIALALCGYFSYHVVSGERGVFKLHALHQQINQERTVLAEALQERETLEQKVVMLRPDSLNEDFLEERIRMVLGYQSPDEQRLIR